MSRDRDIMTVSIKFTLICHECKAQHSEDISYNSRGKTVSLERAIDIYSVGTLGWRVYRPGLGRRSEICPDCKEPRWYDNEDK